MKLDRRQWLAGLGAGVFAGAVLPRGAAPDARSAPAAAPVPAAPPGRAAPSEPPAPSQPPASAQPAALPLRDFEPRSMLHVPESSVPRARFPVIDVHAHLSNTRRVEAGVALGEELTLWTSAADALAIMDRRNIRAMVNLTGGHGAGLAKALGAFDHAAPGRLLSCTEPAYELFTEPDYPQRQADAVVAAARAGARGLKILKTLGLYLRERIDSGPLVAVDDRRFDPMWEACAATGLPVFIHVADPEAFFLPVDRYNERYDELGAHPDWSFHGRDFPSFKELLEARDRLYARHPRTQFLSLHVGHNAENLVAVAAALERFPNTSVELGARIGELGRQPRNARRFFDRYQDRILFGTDAVPMPEGAKFPQQVFNDELYQIYFRFLESEDEYFDYAPAAIPPQGRWRIYGLGLGEAVLRKVYHDNAARLLRLS